MAANGMEWLLELNAKLDGAVKMVRELNRVEAAVGRADSALTKAERNARGVLPRMAGWFRDVGKAAVSDFLGHFAATAVWDSLKAGLGFVIDLGKQLFHAAAEAERTEIAFKNLFGAKVGGDMLAFLDAIAKHTEFTDGQLKSMGQSLAKAGLKGEMWKNALAGILDVAAMSPDKMAGAEAAMGAISRIMLTGSMDARALRALGLAPKEVFGQMAKDLGMGMDQVEKRLRDGKIRTDDVMNSLFKAISAKTGKPLGALGVEMSTTFGARMEKLKDVIPNLFEELSRSKGFAGVSNFLGRLVDAFSPESPAGAKIIAGLESIMNRLGAALATVDLEKWAGRLVRAMELGAAGVALFARGVEVAGVALAAVSGAWEFAIGTGARALGAVMKFGGDALAYITTLPAKIYAAATALGTSLWQGMRDGVLGWVTGLGGAIDDMASGVVGKLKNMLGIRSPSRVFLGLGMMTAAGFAAGLAAGQPMILDGAMATFAPEAVMPASVAGAGYIGAGAAAASGGRSGIGSMSLSVPITVNVGGTTATADEIAEKVAREVPSQILAALEQLGLQGGIA